MPEPSAPPSISAPLTGVKSAQMREIQADYLVWTISEVPPHPAIVRDLRISPWTCAEFFAGTGLVRAALEPVGYSVIWANDNSPSKRNLYQDNFGVPDFRFGDVRHVRGAEVPTVDLATASFPCVDLSLAGSRRGIHSGESSMFWEFVRVIEEMDSRQPATILVENVPGFAYSADGKDFEAAIAGLNDLGYFCDAFVVDARHFVPQSRKRLFIVAWKGVPDLTDTWTPSELRPKWLCDFMHAHRHLAVHPLPMASLPEGPRSLAGVVELLPADDERWWDQERQQRFIDSLSDTQTARLNSLVGDHRISWRTAYRRTRSGVARWEIRHDAIAGCLRTTRGGSSKQALVEAGQDKVRIRWLTSREYGRLQGTSDDYKTSCVSNNEAMFAFGDAVCVPVVRWIAHSYLTPLLSRGLLQVAAAS